MTVASVACTADPSPPGTAPLPSARRRGNPNLALSPRCGARTRAGCPCRAPAIHGKLRCRMHGGRSTGPRTPEGLDRLRRARTIHGRYGCTWRAFIRGNLTFLRRSRVYLAARRYVDRLPPDLAARFRADPPELRMSPPLVGGLTATQDRAIQREEAAALAPWKQAIAVARAAGRRLRATPAGVAAMTVAGPHAPDGRREGKALATSQVGANAGRAAGPHAPIAPLVGAAQAASAPSMQTRGAAGPPAPDAARAGTAAGASPPPTHMRGAAGPHAPDAARAGTAAGASPPPTHMRGAAGPHAPDAVRGGTEAAASPPPMHARGAAGPHAPERTATAGPAASAPFRAPVARHGKPHAPGARPMAPSASPAGSAPASEKAHAPERPVQARGQRGHVSVHRAARRWLRQQKAAPRPA